MKRFLILMLSVLILLSGCTEQPQTAAQVAAESTQLPGECSHEDGNSDGLCDSCSLKLQVVFDIYAINDLHGKIADGDNHPGVDELTSYIKNQRKTNENLLLISVGDMWQGSSESNLTKGLLTTDWMNDIGFNAMVMGNHEYDWGDTFVRSNQAIAQFPYLAINIYDRATNQQIDYCQSSVMIDQNGIQIGIIGAVGDCYSSIAADKVEEIYFKTGNELTQLVMDEATALREQGADFIIYAIHDGYGDSTSNSVTNVTKRQLSDYYDTALSNGYVDLVFEGHTHQRYLLQDEYGVYHMQNGGDNKKGISHVQVSFDLLSGEAEVRSAQLISNGSYVNLDDDPIVEDLLEKYADEVDLANQLVGTNAYKRTSSEMQQLVADLYYDVGMEAWGEDYDIVLGGGFISVRSPYELAAGDVTYGMLQSLFPFDNQLHLCSIKGRDLKDKFFETTNDRYYIAYGTYGEQIRQSIDPNATYYIVVDSYTSSYAPNNLTVIAEYDENIFARDLLADYISTGAFE